MKRKFGFIVVAGLLIFGNYQFLLAIDHFVCAGEECAPLCSGAECYDAPDIEATSFSRSHSRGGEETYSPSSPLAESVLEKTTRLRAEGRPTGTFRFDRRRGTFLEYVKVVIHNTGIISAEGIKVVATLPNNKPLTLQGPTRLRPNQKAVYHASTNLQVQSKRHMSVRAECSNCAD